MVLGEQFFDFYEWGLRLFFVLFEDHRNLLAIPNLCKVVCYHHKVLKNSLCIALIGYHIGKY